MNLTSVNIEIILATKNILAIKIFCLAESVSLEADNEEERWFTGRCGHEA